MPLRSRAAYLPQITDCGRTLRQGAESRLAAAEERLEAVLDGALDDMIEEEDGSEGEGTRSSPASALQQLTGAPPARAGGC
jgi:hypothetical protein